MNEITFLTQGELIQLVFEMIGVAISGFGAHYQIAFVFHGEGANGKGVITQVVQKLLPQNMWSTVAPNHHNPVRHSVRPTCGSRAEDTASTDPFLKLARFLARCAARELMARQITEEEGSEGAED